MDPIEIFARGAWTFIPDDADVSWVERVAALEGSDAPLGDYGPLVKDMLAKGVAPEAIARFAKIVGYETAFGLCYHLGDPNASYEGFPDADQRISWALFQTDPDTDAPTDVMCGVHEVMLSMDPSGLEMRPKGT